MNIERDVTQCPEAECVPANSSQSSGFIELWHVFSGLLDAGLHLIIPQQQGAKDTIASPSYFFFESQNPP